MDEDGSFCGGGSSGSPVFNSDWDLIALHHAGSHEMPKLDGSSELYASVASYDAQFEE